MIKTCHSKLISCFARVSISINFKHIVHFNSTILILLLFNYNELIENLNKKIYINFVHIDLVFHYQTSKL